MAQTVIGIFDSSSEAQQAVQELKSLGISNDSIDISSAAAGTSGTNSTSTTSSTSSDSSYRDNDDNDGISGFFRSLFGDDDDNARAYSDVARSSDCVVTVHAQSDEQARRAAAILDQYGSVDVDQRASEYGYSQGTYGSGSSYSGPMTDNDTNRNNSDTFTSDNSDNFNKGTTGDSTSIPIIEENLQVGKREVETGGVRLRSRIVERPVEEHLRLRTEHVRVERHPVNRPASEADLNGFQEGEIELTEHAEVPIVNKEARVVEEVSLEKDVEERDEVVRETVRSTEVDTDQLNNNNRLDNDGFDNNRTGNDADRNRTGYDTDRNQTGRSGLDNDPSTRI